MGEGGFLDLLNAVAACSDLAHDFVMESYPGFERYYRKSSKIFKQQVLNLEANISSTSALSSNWT